MADNIFDGSTSNDWNTSSNWSLGAVPTASDGHVVVFDASSPNCTLGSTNRVCNQLMMSAYTGTLTFGVRSLTVSGNITLGSGHTFSSTTGGLAINSSGNITTNGYTIPTNFQFAGTSKTYTLQDDLTILGALSFNGVTSLTINNNGTDKTIYAVGSVSSSAAGAQGTANIKMIGTGTIGTTGAIRSNLEFDASGNTITINTSFRYGGGTLKYTSGVMDVTTNNSQFFLGLAGVTTTQIDTSGMTWLNISTPSGTNTLVSDLNVSGQYSSSAAVTFNSGGGHIRMVQSTPYNIIFGGSQTHQGTAKIIFNGTDCQWVGSTGIVQNSIDIDGTLTITNNCNWRIATMTHISGTVSGTGKIYTTSIATWNTSGCTFPNVEITTSNQTLNSTLNVGTLTLGAGGGVNFLGSYGFNVDNLIHTTTNRGITLKAGNTYTVNQSLLMRGSGAPSSSTNSVTLQSDTTFSYAYFNVATGATSNCMWVRAIDIDSTGGRELYTSNGLVSRSLNWVRTNPNAFAFF